MPLNEPKGELMNSNYDVVIIGGGIIGGIIAYELARYDLKILALEKNSLLADETTGANSGVIHGGFDPEPHKIEAKLNVLGNKLWQSEIFPHLKFPYAQIDSLILAFNKEEEKQLTLLYERGLKNKVPKINLKILTAAEVLAKEPNLNPSITKALLCTNSFAIDPVKATLAMFGAAMQNNLKVQKNAAVTSIKTKNTGFEITINYESQISTTNIINAAGHYADDIAKMANLGDFSQTTRRGEYRILSRSEKNVINSICFLVPTIHGKGVVVAPMLDQRIMVGPTAQEAIAKAETRVVTMKQMDSIAAIGQKIVPGLKMSKTELIYAGSRPIDIATNDFVIRYATGNNHFINAAGMQSPAIASAPAIAKEVAKLLANNGTKLKLKANFKPNYELIW